MPPTDPELARFAATGEEAAFGTLVERHAAMVHAAAARRLGRHAHLAADVTQQVFTRLARQARVLPPDIVLGGWLYRQSQRLALNLVRAEQRRARRERLAVMTDDTASPAGERWSELAPVLDEALECLSAQDRDLLLLRYFENQPLRVVGEAFGLSVSATHKRLTRALEKLRVALSRRGVVLSATSLAGLLTAEAARALPAALSISSLTAGALHATAAGGTSAGFFTTLLMTHTTSALAGAAAGLLLTGALYWHQATGTLTPPAAPPEPVSSTAPRPAPLAFSSTATADRQLWEARTVEEIVAALRELLDRPQNRTTTLQVEMLMARVPPDDYLACLKLADTEITGRAKTIFLDQVIKVWGELDPAAAVHALFASDQGKDARGPGKLDDFNSFRKWKAASEGWFHTQFSILFCFRSWLGRDQKEALAWLERHKTDFLPRSSFAEGYQTEIGRYLASEVTRHFHQQDPLLARRLMASLPSEWITINSTILQAAGKADMPELLDTLTALKDHPALPRLESLRVLGGSLSEKMAALRDDDTLDPELRYQAGLALASASFRIVQRDDQALDFHPLTSAQHLDRFDRLMAAVGDTLTPRQFVEAVEAFPFFSEESEAALLTRLQAHPAADEAFEAIANQRLAQKGPEAALAWISHLSETSRRTTLARGIYRRWLDENPEAARHYSLRGNLTPEIRSSLTGLTQP